MGRYGMNRSESKYFNTALLMDKALVQLLAVKDFEYITVKDICQQAGVNRSTFYLHYESVADLLRETMDNLLKEFLSVFPISPDGFLPEIETAQLSSLVLIQSDFIRPYLTFVRDHKEVYAAAYKNPGAMQTDGKFTGMTKHILEPILRRFGVPEKQRRYMIGFYINGCAFIVQEWLRQGCQDSIEEVEQIILNCIRPESGLQNKLFGE